MTYDSPYFRNEEGSKYATWRHDVKDGSAANMWTDGDMINIGCSGYRSTDKGEDGTYALGADRDYFWRLTTSGFDLGGERFDWSRSEGNLYLPHMKANVAEKWDDDYYKAYDDMWMEYGAASFMAISAVSFTAAIGALTM